MEKHSRNEELDTILQAVRLFPRGAGLEEISRRLGPSLPRRTLQRRLADLVKNKELTRKGAGRGACYQYAIDINYSPVSATRIMRIEEPITPYDIPYSPEAKEILQQVQQPEDLRQAVGYHHELLDSYQPNQTFYLPQEMRVKLHHLGMPYGEQRPMGTYARELLNQLLVDLSWNSSRLEGNSYSILETERLITEGEIAPNKSSIDTQMILNHQTAIAYLVSAVEEIGFNRFTIFNLHGMLAEGLLKNPKACGRLRNIAVSISHTQYTPTPIPQLIEECFDQVLDKASVIKDPFEQAFFAMVHLPYLQPFEDINKRVSRLSANIPLIKNNLCPLSFIDVPDQAYINGILAVYEFNRIELLRDVFAWAYERSAMQYSNIRKTLPAADPFYIRYYHHFKRVGNTVIKKAMPKAEAAEYIRNWANKNVKPQDRIRFAETLEINLLAAHEGNFVSFRVSLAEFETWQVRWLGK